MAKFCSIKIWNFKILTTFHPVVYIIYFITTVILISGCKAKYTEEEIKYMARWRCEAITLKNERFALSDSLRSAESDSISNKEVIQKIEVKSKLLKTRSLVVADSIQLALQQLFETKLTTKDLKDEFLKKVDDQMATMNCK